MASVRHSAPEGRADLANGVRLTTSGLSFSYVTDPVLREVSLEVNPGEIVGVIGPNGSGKTTLVKVLSGVLSEYSGSVQVEGEEVCNLSHRQLARMVAVVPQETESALPFTTLEVVLMGRHPYSRGLSFDTAADIEIARWALERSGAAHLAARNIQRLSSGERQRVVFARALAQQPGALLLDEPTSFMDIRYQVELYDLVRGLAVEDGITVLTTLHDLNLAAEYCDRIYLIGEGCVRASGPTDEVLTYANLTEVFETDVYVDTNDLTGKLMVIPLSGRARDELSQRRKAPTR